MPTKSTKTRFSRRQKKIPCALLFSATVGRMPTIVPCALRLLSGGYPRKGAVQNSARTNPSSERLRSVDVYLCHALAEFLQHGMPRETSPPWIFSLASVPASCGKSNRPQLLFGKLSRKPYGS